MADRYFPFSDGKGGRWNGALGFLRADPSQTNATEVSPVVVTAARPSLGRRIGWAMQDFAERVGGPNRGGAHESAEALWQAAVGRGASSRNLPHTEAELEGHRWGDVGYGIWNGGQPQEFPNHQASVAYAQRNLPAAAARLGVPEVGFTTQPMSGPGHRQRVIARQRGVQGATGRSVENTAGYTSHGHPGDGKPGPSGRDYRTFDLMADVDPNRLHTVVDANGDATVIGLERSLRANGYPIDDRNLVDRTLSRRSPGSAGYRVRHPFYAVPMPLARR